MKVYDLDTHDKIEELASQFPDRLIIIDFWATWCGPCGPMKKYFKELAAQYQDGIFICVDIDQDPTGEIKKIYNITSIPLFVFIKNNEVIDFLLGANKTELLNKVNQNLKVTFPKDPLERSDQTEYRTSQEKSYNPPPITQARPQHMQTFHKNPYAPPQNTPSQSPHMAPAEYAPQMAPTEYAPPPPQPQIQYQQHAQQYNSNIHGNMSGLGRREPRQEQPPPQPMPPSGDGPVELPPELF